MKTLTNIFYKLLITIGVLTLIVFGFGVFLYFQFTAQNEKIGRIDDINYGNTAIQIPFTYSKTNHVIVELSIDNSEKKYPFILDSGASSMLFKNSNSNFDFETIGRAISFDAYMTPFFTKIKRIPKISISNVKATNVSFKEYEGFEKTECFESVYGILGNTFMKHFAWLIDFEGKVIYLAKEAEMLPPIPSGSYRVPLRKGGQGRNLYIDTEQFGEVSLDTGASGVCLNIETSDSLKKKLKPQKILGNLYSAIKGHSNKVEWSESTIDSFQLGNMLVEKLPVHLYQGNSFNLLGLAFLKKFRVYLDWKNSEMWLSPIAEKTIFTLGEFGLRFDYDEELFISSVVENDTPYQYGIRPGEKNISIEGHRFKSESEFCSFKKQLSILDTLTLNWNGEKIILTKKTFPASFLQ